MSRKRPYEIKSYTIEKARGFGVEVAPSNRKNYKIDIYDSDGAFICSIGDRRYSDYPTYFETKGRDYAEKRRKLYHLRHHHEKDSIGTPGWFAYHLLW